MAGFFNNIDFGEGAEIFDRFEIDPTKPVEGQLDTVFDHQVFQAQLRSGYVIDIGWYDYDDGERFGILLILDRNWDNPFVEIQTRDLFVLKASVAYCVELATLHMQRA